MPYAPHIATSRPVMHKPELETFCVECYTCSDLAPELGLEPLTWSPQFKYLLLTTPERSCGISYMFIFLLLFCLITLGFKKIIHESDLLKWREGFSITHPKPGLKEVLSYLISWGSSTFQELIKICLSIYPSSVRSLIISLNYLLILEILQTHVHF